MNEPYLAHHGVKGQKWGVRHYIDKNGNLTKEGHQRYSKKNGVEQLARDIRYDTHHRHRVVYGGIGSIAGGVIGNKIGKKVTDNILGQLGISLLSSTILGEGMTYLGEYMDRETSKTIDTEWMKAEGYMDTARDYLKKQGIKV